VRFARHADFADKIISCIVESPAGVARLPAMLAIADIDIWIIGVNDLAHNLGYPGRPNEAEVQEEVGRAVDAIVGSGRVCGMLVTPATLPKLVARGVRALLTSVDLLLARGAAEFSELLAAQPR
jgi:2-keto-3-deoxy-L-rhamnonate aldolase RhmA